MNDTELDEMLNGWKAPAAPASMRAKARAAFAAKHERPRRFAGWVPSFASALVGAGLVFVVVTAAMPQTPDLTGVPYTVDSELTSFGRDGSQMAARITSYNRDGIELVLSRWRPDNPFGTVWMHAITSFHGMMGLHDAPSGQYAATAAGCGHPMCSTLNFYASVPGSELVKSGCELEGTVVGHEDILGVPTVAVLRKKGENTRITFWRAPSLSCFAMRVRTEWKQENGSFYLGSEKQALKVVRYSGK